MRVLVIQPRTALTTSTCWSWVHCVVILEACWTLQVLQTHAFNCVVQAHKNGVAEPSPKLALPRVALAVALLSGADTKVLVEGLPGNLPESECSAVLRAIPAVVSVSFVPETEPDSTTNGENETTNHTHDTELASSAMHADHDEGGPDVPENGKQEGSVSTGVHMPRSAVVEVATAAAVQPLVSHLEMIKVGGCELRARLLLEPCDADAAVQALIDTHERELRNTSDIDAAVAAGATEEPSGEGKVVEESLVTTGVLRLVKALRCEELEGQREGIMHDVRCVAARYGDVVGVDIASVEGTANAAVDSDSAPGVEAPVDTSMEGADDGGNDGEQYRDIVVKYKSCQGADRAALALQGRMFAERPLVAVVESC